MLFSSSVRFFAATAAKTKAPTPIVAVAAIPASKPLNGYNIFTKEHMAQHPGTKFADIATAWKAKTDDEKAVFTKKAQVLALSAPPAPPKRTVSPGVTPVPPPAAAAVVVATPKPARRLSGYNLFTKEYIGQHPGSKMAEAAQVWKSKSEEQQLLFKTRASELPLVTSVPVSAASLEPKERKKSAWDYFLAVYRTSNDAKGKKPTEILKSASVEFQKLSDSEKEELKQK